MFGMILIVAVGLGKAMAACVICAVAGFGAGRIKNAAKLERIADVIGEGEHFVSSEARDLVARLKGHL